MHNRRIKLLAGALRLNSKEIARAVTLGGVPTSNSRADSWLRAQESLKNPAGNSDRTGPPQRRFRATTDEEFDAFCVGLKPLLDEMEGSDE